ncbi:MAG: UDP-2,3-diacylglucosamine diphosphatase [Xanthomonadales bacterium]|nr:UDP-2,3-diacylglucosamine diphosphatase [Xanthomonadales bacterium]
MSTLFVSDLHLDSVRPHILDAFDRFIVEHAPSADALYILGDLFEAWIGDDSGDEAGRRFVDAMKPLRDAHKPCFFIHGNRDFLLGEAYARRAGMTLLADPSVVEIEGVRTLLMHGDTLCTDDTAYQVFRAQARSPAWQRAFLARPRSERETFARQARAESQRYTTDTTNSALMDVNDEAVRAAMRANGCLRLIHGHTHRPATHRFELDGQPAERIVLGDWYEHESWLVLA